MSDPRYTGSGYPDPRDPRDPMVPRRLDPERQSGSAFAWVAAIVAIALIGAVAIGYYHHEPTTAANSPSTTTGSAPTPRPAAPPSAPVAPPPDVPATPGATTPAAPPPATAPHP
jgi:type IV secretory pathway VirB10-like protein